MTRRCKNWIQTFIEWTYPVSEAPDSLLIWSGLFCLSAVLKRKVEFSKEYLKKYEVFPTMYVMFVGPPGVVRKSTTAGYAEKLIIEMNESIGPTDPAYVYLGPTSGSHSKIIEKMANSIDGTMSIIAGEFGVLVSVSPEGTYDFFAKMFDNDPRYMHSTRMYGDEIVTNPSLNLLGCTTPDWIAENTGYMMGGGFAARTVFIFEYKARKRSLFYKDVSVSLEELDLMKDDLIHDLKIIGRMTGEFTPESKALQDKMEEWYQEYGEIAPAKNTETFVARKHIHAMRTAMLLSAADSNSLIITDEHWTQSLLLINDVESKLSRGLSAVGRNPYSADLYQILDYIKRHGIVEKGKVLAAFWQNFSSPGQDFASVLEVLKATGEIEEVDIGGKKSLRICQK